jgi:hypothetical protein
MKKFLIISLVILVIAAVMAAVGMYGRNKKPPTTQSVEQVSVEGVGVPEGKKPSSGIGTLKELQARGTDLECQIILERAAAEGNIEGTFFTSKGNIRADFMVPAPDLGGKILSSMIVGGPSMYVWSKIEKNTFGFKSDLTNEKTKHMDTKEPVSLDVQVKYTCTDWTSVDGSVFVPPADVTFKDLNAVVEEGGESGLKPQTN